MNIKVGIVEDNDSVRENLAELIDQTPGFACVAACGSAEEALERLRQACPEVVLMDIHLPGQSGIACVARLRRLLPQTQVIMLTVEEDSERVFESLKAGAPAIWSSTQRRSGFWKRWRKCIAVARRCPAILRAGWWQRSSSARARMRPARSSRRGKNRS